MKKFFAIFIAVFILICTFTFSCFANVSIDTNPYFHGTNKITLQSATLDGSYSSYPINTYINGSFDMPFYGYNGTVGGQTQKYNYNSVSDLIIDYTDYKQGTIAFYIEFYNDNSILYEVEIKIEIDDNGTGQATDDFYKIAAFCGNDNLDKEFKKIVPMAQPYIAFNLGALHHKSNYNNTPVTEFKIYFENSKCRADFNIYGVMANYDISYEYIYNNGFNKGYINGESDGYNNGYSDGRLQGKIDFENSFDRDAIYNEGWKAGLNEGASSNAAYDIGFEAGKEWQYNYDKSTGEVSNFFLTIGGAFMSAFLYFGNNVSFFGISLLAIIGAIIVGILIYIGIKAAKGN